MSWLGPLGQKSYTRLMAEMADAGEHHRDVRGVGGGDDFVVLFAASGLSDRGHPGFDSGLETVREREERIGCEHAAARACCGFLARYLDRAHARRLAAADADGLEHSGSARGAAEHNRVAPHVFADGPRELE